MRNRLIIFDLDNTLVKTKQAAKIAYKQAINYIAKMHGIENKRNKLYNHWKRIVSRLRGERKPYKRRFRFSLAKLLEAQKIPETYFNQALVIYEKELLKNLEVQKGARDLLGWLKEGGHKVAVATGSARSEAIKKLKKAELWQWVDFLATPSVTKVMKPDKLFYVRLMGAAKVGAEETIVVGDSEREDLAPARELGLKTVLVPHKEVHLGKIKDQLRNLVVSS